MTNEQRLEQLREQAWDKGIVVGRGVDVAGGPIARRPGYYGEPVVKPPGWTWAIPVYFFIGGLTAIAAVIELVGLFVHRMHLERAAMWLAAVIPVFAPVLLTTDTR